MTRNDYDSYRAFERALITLENFNELIAERHLAGYTRKERLQEWVILGRFTFDSCGNCMKFTGKDVPADIFPGIPAILSRQDFAEYVNKNSGGREYWFSSSIGDGIPSHRLLCPVCARGWTIDNCHDTVVGHETKIIDMAHHLGRQLSDVKVIWSNIVDAVWIIQPDCAIRNDLYIDNTIVQSLSGPQYNHKKNERGWIAADDSYRVRIGDEAMVNVWTYRHYHCHRRDQLAREQAYFQEIFALAGFKNTILTATENQYCSCEVCAPWFYVMADGINFLIGWRKRVINIKTSDPRIDFSTLFSKEDVTKETGAEYSLIHAWSKQKCIEYLKTLKHIYTE